jgi:uncharacterized protein YraI
MRKENLSVLGALTLALAVASSAANANPITSPANVRSGPGTAWPVISVAPAGAEVDVLTCGTGWNHRWCQVDYGGMKGYVNAAALAGVGANVVIAPVVTTDLANLRTRPSLFSSVVEVIPGGETVNVLHCRSGMGRGWCHVAYEDKTGYVRGGLLHRQVMFPR